MRGRHVLMETLVGHGIDYLFGNPGTTESPIIESLQDYPQIRYVMALHEGVAIGAASYYAQASGRTGVVNLHVAPGLGNALGMLYNASKAGSPLLVTAGQQDTRLRLRAPLLGHDLAAMAAPLVKWSAQVERADELAPLLRRALKIAQDPPSGPVFVALPIDVLEQETADTALPPGTLYLDAEPDPAGVAAVADVLLDSRSPVIVAGDDIRRGGRRSISSRWPSDSAPRCSSRPAPARRVPDLASVQPRRPRFDAAAIRKALDGSDAVLLVGGPFFEECGSPPGRPSRRRRRCCRSTRARAPLAQFALRAVSSPVRCRPPRAAGRRSGATNAAFRQAAAARNTVSGRSRRRRSPRPGARRQALGCGADLHPALHGRCGGDTPRRRRRGRRGRSPPASISVARLSFEAGRVLRPARRGHRPGPARRARRRLARPDAGRRRHVGGRLGDVLDPGAVDRRPPRHRRGLRDPRQPRVPDPQAQHGRLPPALRRSLRAPVPAHGPEQAGAGLRGDRAGMGVPARG